MFTTCVVTVAVVVVVAVVGAHITCGHKSRRWRCFFPDGQIRKPRTVGPRDDTLFYDALHVRHHDGDGMKTDTYMPRTQSS